MLRSAGESRNSAGEFVCPNAVSPAIKSGRNAVIVLMVFSLFVEEKWPPLQE